MRRLICAVIFTVLIAGNLSCAETKYVIKDLGVLPGDTDSTAAAINSKGQIVGQSGSRKGFEGAGRPPMRPFLWDKGRISEIESPVKKGDIFIDINDLSQVLICGEEGMFVIQGGKATKIEPPPGYSKVGGQLNNLGQVLGFGFKEKWQPEQSVLFLWRNGVTKVLEKPARFPFLHYGSLNNKGQITAILGTIDGSAADRMVMWENGKLRDLKYDPARIRVQPNAISDDGTIIGRCSVADKSHPCVMRNGVPKYLIAPKGLKDPLPACINSGGVIGGYCAAGEDGTRAVVWDKAGVPTALPTLGGKHSGATGINNSGVLIGMSLDKSGASHAVMWTPVK